MAKREKAEPKQIPKDLIITQCAYRGDTEEETRQRLKDAGHPLLGKIYKQVAERREELSQAGLLADHLDCSQAAEITGLIPRRVRAYCMDGRLGRKMSSSYIISREELLKFIEIKRQAGIPGQRARAEERETCE